jgi:hypothetical protein
MKRARRRKCRCCHELFRPDPRNLRHQRYCSKASCRRASHAASQGRWLAKAENRDYLRGADNVARVQACRREHPGYWRQRRVVAAMGSDSIKKLEFTWAILIESDPKKSAGAP